MGFTDRFKSAIHAFKGREPTDTGYQEPIQEYISYFRPDRTEFSLSSFGDVLDIIYNKIAVDCSMFDIWHVKLDDDGNYISSIKDSSLYYALTTQANIDQTGREFIKDIVFNMLKIGVVAAVPTIWDEYPSRIEVYELRSGIIKNWMPDKVTVEVFNDITGRRQEYVVSKKHAAICENPFYYIMNERNSMAERLTRVLRQLDKINSKAVNPPLDLIFQLPFNSNNPNRDKLAKRRKKEIEDQLENSNMGIAWIDNQEKVIQLNRSVENNLWDQAISLLEILYNQLGISKEVFDGTADEKTMLNYYNRTIAPILSTVTENMDRKWITKTARTQGQAIRFYRDPFKIVPVEQMAEITDKMRRNVVLTSNEIRSKLGFKPSDDPIASLLVNSNINQSKEEIAERKKKITDEEE